MTAATIPANPAERLATLIDGLRQAVAAHGARGFLTAALQLLLWGRLSRMAQRARCLAGRMAAGEPLVAPRPARTTPRPPPSRPYTRLPRGTLWLIRVVPGTASGAETLRFLLTDPDMADLAHAPPMRRLLQPLCRMLGVAMPPAPKPAPAKAAARESAASEPSPAPSDPVRAEPSPSDPPVPPAAIPKHAA